MNPPSPPNDTPPADPGTRRPAAWVWLVRVSWIVQVVGLVALLVWTAADGRVAPCVGDFGDLVGSVWGGPPPSFQWSGRHVAILVIALCLTDALLLAAVGLVMGSPKQRSLRSWLALTALVCVWLAFFGSWAQWNWHFQQWRLAGRLSAFDTLVASLQADWPQRDGDLPALGPFNAYPIGRPTVLLPIAPPVDPATGIAVQSVERSPEGALRLELSGAENNVWLEWHSEGDEPISFRGGLGANHELRRSTELSRHWYAVRYDRGR